MAKQTKAARREQQDAIAQLREMIKPGDTVYTVLDHVSSSGMMRAIRVVVPLKGASEGEPVDFRHPNWAIGKALGLKHWKRNGREQDALVLSGCGMDMGFHLVYELSHTLYGGRWCSARDCDARSPKAGCQQCNGTGYDKTSGYQCLGKGKCPSNYHVNHRDFERCSGVRDEATGDYRSCWKPDGWFPRREDIPADWPRAVPKVITDGEGAEVTLPGRMLACLSGSGEDGKPYEVCPTCKGEGQLPNPAGPERFDLVHTDGYALRHRWL